MRFYNICSGHLVVWVALQFLTLCFISSDSNWFAVNQQGTNISEMLACQPEFLITFYVRSVKVICKKTVLIKMSSLSNTEHDVYNVNTQDKLYLSVCLSVCFICGTTEWILMNGICVGNLQCKMCPVWSHILYIIYLKLQLHFISFLKIAYYCLLKCKTI
jgi:hypothetical protein